MSFEQTVLSLSAPALCGIKPSNLFSMNLQVFKDGFEKLQTWNRIFHRNGTYILPIIKNNRVLVYVYNRDQIEKICNNKNAVIYLISKGYCIKNGFEAILTEFFCRLMNPGVFPNEAGLFLGYPLNDVIQFENNHGQNYSFCGTWKVYGNKESAIKQMDKYKNCREICMNLLDKGIPVPAVTEIFKKNYLKEA